MTTPNLPAHWNDADVLSGANVTDKADLLGVPFLAKHVEFSLNAEGRQTLWLTVETVHGKTVQITDSSTGVRQQVAEYLAKTGRGNVVEDSRACPIRLVAPQGLRVSTYDAKDARGKTVKARTYYLTTDGVLPAPETDADQAPKTPRKATTTPKV